MKTQNTTSGEALASCGCISAILAANITLGSCAFDYCLWSVFGKNVPWFADAVVGLFFGEFTVPGAIICWVLRLCGMEVPFIH